MHAWLRDLAIRKKVALIVTLTTAVALLLASTVFVVYDLVSFWIVDRKTMRYMSQTRFRKPQEDD